jgi:arylsulfatase A-like enzyme
MTERFCEAIAGRQAPPYAVLWLSEPDHTAHHHPLGSPAHRQAMREADANLARVLDAVARSDPNGERTLVAVCSDHGMQTIRRKVDVAQELVQAGLKASLASNDVVVAPQGTAVLIHLAPAASDRLQPTLDWLARQDFAGDIAAGEQLAHWGLPTGGTLAIAVGLAGDDEPNEHGIPGRSDVAENALGGESLPGHGQHGGLGPYEQRPFLALAGAGVQPGQRDAPASLIDLAPTFLAHLGLPAQRIDGRALT